MTAHQGASISQFSPPNDHYQLPHIRLLERQSISASKVGIAYKSHRNTSPVQIIPNMVNADVHSLMGSPLRFLMSVNGKGPWTDEWLDHRARERAAARSGRTIL